MRNKIIDFADETAHKLNEKRIEASPKLESAGRKFFFNLAAYGLVIVGIGSLVKPLLNPVYPEFKTDSEIQVQSEISESIAKDVVTVDTAVEQNISEIEYPLLLQPFYFNPIRDGANCNDDCRFTRTEVRVLEDDYKTPFGPFWWGIKQQMKVVLRVL